MKWAISISIFSIALSSIAFANDAGYCDLSSQWRTADQLDASYGYSQAYGLGSGGGLTLAVGYGGKAATNWLVRQTQTGGDTWQTVENGLSGYQESIAYAAAVDPQGVLFVAGRFGN